MVENYVEQIELNGRRSHSKLLRQLNSADRDRIKGRLKDTFSVHLNDENCWMATSVFSNEVF